MTKIKDGIEIRDSVNCPHCGKELRVMSLDHKLQDSDCGKYVDVTCPIPKCGKAFAIIAYAKLVNDYFVK
jgi:hypothetical protein